ncbi:A24 family peptidase [bacterium]|nr:A24 family peptidase [bacterium]
MALIFQYLLVILFGYAAGVLVNFVSDWYYVRREFLGDVTIRELKETGWLKYLVWPFRVRTVPVEHKIRVLIVEAIYIALGFWMWFARPERVELWWGIPVLLYFGIVIVMDIEFRVVLHPISIAGAVLGSLVGVYLRGPWVTLGGGVAGFAIMFFLYKLGEMFMNWVNRRRDEMIDEVALGYGDVNMAGVVGLFLGWPPIVLGLLYAIFTAGIVSILFIVISVVIRRFRAFAALPYAPFLALAALTMLFFPEQIANLLGG